MGLLLSLIGTALKAHGRHVTLYSGYTLEELLSRQDPVISQILDLADILMGGPFVQDLSGDSVEWRGSTNRVLSINIGRPAIAIRAERVAPHLTADESALLARINHILPTEDRMRALIEKRDEETIATEEWRELAALTDRLELLRADMSSGL